MTTAPEDETDSQTGPRQTGLWARVCDWLDRWIAVFPPEEILRDGLSRRFALRCCNWLWPLEAAVRRLIIAAAMAFDPAKLAPVMSGRQRRGGSRPAHGRPASFRIVSIRGGGSPQGPASVVRTVGSAPRHLPFPGDDLLRLGFFKPRKTGAPSLRRPHPLIRRGRIWPHDPDYLPDEERDYANSSPLLFGDPANKKPGRPPRDPHAADRDIHRPIRIEPEGSDWRRIEQEWDRVLPAPGIARRIAALIDVVDAPERHVERLARRLRAQPFLAELLHAQPAPVLRRPKYDRLGPQVDEDILPLAHAEMHPPDTS